MSLILATRLARARPLIIPRGSSSISRMVGVLTDGTSTFVGSNSYRTSPLVKRFSGSESKLCLHCEMDSIGKAIRYFAKRSGSSYRKMTDALSLKDFTLSVARVLASGEPALARPCPVCWRAIDKYQISNVEWTT